MLQLHAVCELHRKKSKLTLKKRCRLCCCGKLHAKTLQIYQNVPTIVRKMHFFSPTLVILYYGYDNFDNVKSAVYQPLKDSVAPVMHARVALEQFKGTVAQQRCATEFVQTPANISALENQLNKECVQVVAEAAKIHPVFQLLVTGMLADGSPNILFYIIGSFIKLKGVLDFTTWVPKQMEDISEWLSSGMEDDFEWEKMWEVKNKKGVGTGGLKYLFPSALLWLAEVFIADWLLMDSDDVFSLVEIVQIMQIGIMLVGIGQLSGAKDNAGAKEKTDAKETSLTRTSTRIFWATIFKHAEDLKKAGIGVILAPLLFNYVTGAELFPHALWLFVTYLVNPKQITGYLAYGFVVVKILREPLKFKLDFETRLKRESKREKDDEEKTKKADEKLKWEKEKWEKEIKEFETKKKFVEIMKGDLNVKARAGNVKASAKKWKRTALTRRKEELKAHDQNKLGKGEEGKYNLK